MNKKVIILTASTGGGHNKASNAIKTEFDKLGIQCKIVDSFKDIGTVGKALDVFVSQGYEKSARYAPKVYGRAYKVADRKIVRKTFDINLITTYMEKNILKKLKNEDFTHIIGTHPFPLIAVSNLKNKDKIDLPIYSVITDYTVHLAHIAKEIDHYIVAHEDTMINLISEGIKEKQIHPYGIPVTLKDYTKEEIEDFKHKNNIDDNFTVLIVGGSFGAGNITRVYKQIKEIQKPLNIIVICGRNESLKSKLDELIYEDESIHTTKIIGYTDEIEKYYQSCDVIITKPGGLTVTECMHKKVPMIIPFFIPGQEEGNKDFVVNNQMGIYTSRYYKLNMVITKLMEDKNCIDLMKKSMENNFKKDSALNIAKLIMDSSN